MSLASTPAFRIAPTFLNGETNRSTKGSEVFDDPLVPLVFFFGANTNFPASIELVAILGIISVYFIILYAATAPAPAPTAIANAFLEIFFFEEGHYFQE